MATLDEAKDLYMQASSMALEVDRLEHIMRHVIDELHVEDLRKFHAFVRIHYAAMTAPKN